jgi:signal-transduction protein with cAMP-binding, CBS, and nucleotidyltransferase domain
MTQRTTSRSRGDITPATPLRDMMHRDPVIVEHDTRVVDAARTMQNRDIGDVLVRTAAGGYGILTDRDLVVRLVANERDPAATTAGELCSSPTLTLDAGDTVGQAVVLMRQRAVRRLPVMDNGTPVGIVTLGDLAMEREPDSLLGDISAAPPNL